MSCFEEGRVLVLAPHTDDAELGCGGTVARLVEEGRDVHVAMFSLCDKSLPEGFFTDDLRREFTVAMGELGVCEGSLHVFDYAVREFPSLRQEILEDMVRLRGIVYPSLVLMPSLNDVHQDHATVAQEGLRAFKRSTVLCYEDPWNNFSFQNQMFVTLTDEQLEKKVAAVYADVSQRGRDYTQPEFIRSLAHVRGVQIGVPYAEVFEAPRIVL